MTGELTVLSFDVDRTLVDRNRHSHEVSERIRDSLLSAHAMPSMAVVLNTGRDLSALREFDAEVEADLDALFLSGRGERIGSEITIEPGAAVPMRVVASLFDYAEEAEIPFLDVKTGSGAVHIPLSDSPLPFGFQKPKGWYNRFLPAVLDAPKEEALASLEVMGPIRIEVPVRTEDVPALRSALALREGFFTEVMPIHPDYVNEKNSDPLRAWNAFQILTPFEGHNKGSSLKRYTERLNGAKRVVHFGDSDHSHNSDSIVTRFIPEAEFVRIDWNRQSQEEIEDLIAEKLSDYIS